MNLVDLVAGYAGYYVIASTGKPANMCVSQPAPTVWNEDGMLIRDFTTLFPTQRDVVTDQARPTAPWIKKQ